MPIARRSAIHHTVIVVSARKRAAKTTFAESPLGRVFRSASCHRPSFNSSRSFSSPTHQPRRIGLNSSLSSAPRRIQVDVIAHALEITAARSVHDQRLVAPGEQVAEELVTPVEATRVSAKQPFHSGDQIGLRRLDDQMEMIRHEDIGVNLPARLSASLAQRVDEALAIRIIHEDQFAPVTAIHDVIKRASLLDSQLAGHTRGVALAALYINIKN